MGNLIIPQIIEIQLTDSLNQPIGIDNVLVYIKTKARRKNDFHLGPFISDSNGLIKITKTDFMNEVESTYDSALMDYSSIESNLPEIEFRLYTTDEIDKMIYSRAIISDSLLKGENERWNSIDELIEILKTSKNKLLELNENNRNLVVSLNGEADEFKLNMKIETKPNNGYT